MPFKILHTNISNKTVIVCNLIQIEMILVFKWSLLKDDKLDQKLILDYNEN